MSCTSDTWVPEQVQHP